MRFDAETGLYHTPFRAYDPQDGRWMQLDPAGLVDGLNRYAYVGNSPLMGVDPTGLNCIGDGKILTCDPPGDDTAPYQIPQMEGLPNEIGDTQPYSHVYRVETST
ncbi:MAG: RHS repeat-associated core domain-containing protein, partial [Niveispirillum sp.]|uniref:RHS repeat-associated core domain-containing protein n=1 Tax=Niveispirillum sp. TaxID=1917217 RepID=UPI003BA51644